MRMRTILILLAALTIASACRPKQQAGDEGEWVVLFNGKDLEGWTPKIKGYPAGENFANTFRVEEGLLKVRYDGYDAFGERFGHLFYSKKKFSNYRLRVEYRFVGEQAKNGPGWAWRNSGAMLHCQSPESMHLNQDFPVSIEAQILGGDGESPRTTSNVCTPGTEIWLNGEPFRGHCANSDSETFHGDQWVTAEFIVHGDRVAYHVIGRDTVMTYTNLSIGGGNVSPTPNVTEGPLTEGYISLQSESHPIDFRKVEIMELSE